jgi:uncharacterized SAM-binding protein YcdF (DUF218 family)
MRVALRSDGLRRRMRGRGVFALTLGALFGLAVFLGLVYGAAGFSDRIRAQPGLAPLSQAADGVVALTGGPDRIALAASLLATGQARRMLISGVNQLTTRSQLSRETPRFAQLIDCCVDIGYLAENTFGNAVETARWAKRHGIRRLVVVTSDYHMPRALTELRAALPGAELIASPVKSPRLHNADWWRDLDAWRLVIMEYAKFLRAQLRTSIDPQRAARAAGTSIAA